MMLEYSSTILNNTFFKLIGVPVIILAGFWILEVIVRCYVFPLLQRITKKTPSSIDDKLVVALSKPVSILILLTGLYVALLNFPPLGSEDILLGRIFRSIIVIVIAWGICLITGINSIFLAEFKEKYQVDTIVISFFSKAIKFVIIAMALVLIANEWNYDVNGFIAGLGLGGLAFALAAKDALANIFGGIVIILEKPFAIGDWIETSSPVSG